MGAFAAGGANHPSVDRLTFGFSRAAETLQQPFLAQARVQRARRATSPGPRSGGATVAPPTVSRVPQGTVSATATSPSSRRTSTARAASAPAGIQTSTSTPTASTASVSFTITPAASFSFGIRTRWSPPVRRIV